MDCGSGQGLWEMMSDKAESVIRQRDNGKQKVWKQNKRVFCPPSTKTGGGEKYTSSIQNHLIFGKIQECIFIYIYIHKYMLVQESVLILQLVTGKV